MFYMFKIPNIKFSKAFVVFTVIFVCFSASLFCKPYKSNVVVSFYAEDFHGKKTSNGEIFNMWSMTCAHKSLPFDTILKITNRANGKSVQVRVNDRGPFVANRECDLSKGAAAKIGMIKTGIARVDISIVKMGPNTRLSRETAAGAAKIMKKKGLSYSSGSSSAASGSGKVKQSAPVQNRENKVYAPGTYWDIQVGAYSKRENANKLAQDLLRRGFKNVVFQKTPDIYRVVIRNVPASKVKAMEESLRRCGYTKLLIRQRLK